MLIVAAIVVAIAITIGVVPNRSKELGWIRRIGGDAAAPRSLSFITISSEWLFECQRMSPVR